MDDKGLRDLLADFMDVIGDLASEVESLKTSRIGDPRIQGDLKRTALEERVRSGSARHPEPRTLSEKVASLRGKVKTLQT